MSHAGRFTSPKSQKSVSGNFDRIGEWPGLLKLSPEWASRLAAKLGQYIETGRTGEPYEEAIRDILLEAPPGTFAITEISGIPWIEIDFPSDLLCAEKIIMPLVSDFFAEETLAAEWPRIDQVSGE